MAALTGSDILARSLVEQGTEALFFVMGGPMLQTESALIKAGVRAIDTHHEQAAAFMAHAWGRIKQRPGVCMGCSGPGALNLTTGVANAFVDCAPLVVAIGGSSPTTDQRKNAFQEIDQLSVFKPITKWSERILDATRIPDLVATAFRQAISGKPGPVYLDLPGDVLRQSVDEEKLRFPPRSKLAPRGLGDPAAIKEAITLLSKAERPLLLGGSGVWWSDAASVFQKFVEKTGIPFYTTPISRGSVPEDHDLAFLNARAKAFAEADVLLVVGTRFNYMIHYGDAPRFAANLKIIHVDIDAAELNHNRASDVPIVGDARAVLQQLLDEAEGKVLQKNHAKWIDRLRALDADKKVEAEKGLATDQMPIHPLRLCKEVRDFIKRDAILVVDGQEILNYGRQSIPTFVPGHRLNSGPFGCMGVGLPFGIGAKLAKPDAQVVVLHGDGSYGLSAMEIESAVRHNIPIITVISNNGGWTGDPQKNKPGRNLGYARYDQMAIAFGAHGEFVEKPEDIRPALERAAQSGKAAVVNVITDYRATATTVKFAAYTT